MQYFPMCLFSVFVLQFLLCSGLETPDPPLAERLAELMLMVKLHPLGIFVIENSGLYRTRSRAIHRGVYPVPFTLVLKTGPKQFPL